MAKITGLKNPVMTGPARVFDDEQSALAAIMAQEDRRRRRDGAALPRPQGRAGHAGDAGADGRADRPGPGRDRSAWSPTGASRAAPGAWSSATSRPRPTRAAPSRWCRRATRSPSTPTACCCSSTSATSELARRRAAWKAPAPRYTRGVLAKFAFNASSASLGAVLDDSTAIVLQGMRIAVGRCASPLVSLASSGAAPPCATGVLTTVEASEDRLRFSCAARALALDLFDPADARLELFAVCPVEGACRAISPGSRRFSCGHPSSPSRGACSDPTCRPRPTSTAARTNGTTNFQRSPVNSQFQAPNGPMPSQVQRDERARR